MFYMIEGEVVNATVRDPRGAPGPTLELLLRHLPEVNRRAYFLRFLTFAAELSECPARK